MKLNMSNKILNPSVILLITGIVLFSGCGDTTDSGIGEGAASSGVAGTATQLVMTFAADPINDVKCEAVTIETQDALGALDNPPAETIVMLSGNGAWYTDVDCTATTMVTTAMLACSTVLSPAGLTQSSAPVPRPLLIVPSGQGSQLEPCRKFSLSQVHFWSNVVTFVPFM